MSYDMYLNLDEKKDLQIYKSQNFSDIKHGSIHVASSSVMVATIIELQK